MPTLARLLLLLIAIGAPPAALAQVARCTDARGAISYTDGSCPPGTRPAGAVPVPAMAPTQAPADRGADLASTPQPEPAPARAQSSDRTRDRDEGTGAPASGPAVIGPAPRPSPENQRASRRGYENEGADQWREPGLDRGSSPYEPYDPYAPYGPPGYDPYRPRVQPPRPPIDQRPPLRGCDASGCTDTLGNHYDRRGRLDSYTGPKGQTCRPVGTTVICR